MKVNRLFQIVYILLDKKTVTARELAERLDVSVRTIYRDIDTLSSSNIPIYTSKGTGGGISILPNFVLNKSVLTDEEQKEILAGLQSLRVAGYPDADGTLDKMGSLFNKNSYNWIDIDFSSWGTRKNMDHYFYMLKSAILENRVVGFDYYSVSGGKSSRQVEPLRLLFKDRSWYLQAYCRQRKAVRYFKLSRALNLSLLEDAFTPYHTVETKLPETWGEPKPVVRVRLKFSKDIAYRVYDDFDINHITRLDSGEFYYEGYLPDDISTYTFLLSFGEDVEILEPPEIRNKMKIIVAQILKKYN